MVWPAELLIERGAIVANWQALRRGPTAAVVKADAYGLGAVEVVPALFEAGCRQFFTAHPGEALAIRPLLPDAMVAVLNGLWPGLEETFSGHDLTPVLGTLAEIDRWRAHAERLGRVLPGIVHVDTGMNRLGLDRHELAVLADDPSRLWGIDLRYVMTHLVSAECPEDPVNEQQRGPVCGGLCHAAAGAAIICQLLGAVSRTGICVRSRPAGSGAIRGEPHAGPGQPAAPRDATSGARAAGARRATGGERRL